MSRPRQLLRVVLPLLARQRSAISSGMLDRDLLRYMSGIVIHAAYTNECDGHQMTIPPKQGVAAVLTREIFRALSRLSPFSGLILCGVLSWLSYLAIAFGTQSLHGSGSHGHSLLGLLGLFGAAFGLYLVALRVALRLPDDRRLLGMLWAGAVAFRVPLLLCNPIEEIDLYRYVWDGAVSNCGVSPFRYAPQQVLAASANDALPEDLARLVRLRDASPELAEILRRIHFGELPTIYPPVSQAVFACCSWLTPADSSVALRLTLMKAWFTVFDLLTLALVLRLLPLMSRHRGWAFAYGWCPLVVKEIANSGHLDALAMCLTTLAVTWTLLAWLAKDEPRRCLRLSLVAALALALGVGAKLYPIVLAPLLLWTLAKGASWRTGLSAATVFGTATLLILWPMRPMVIVEVTPAFDESAVVARAGELPPLPPPETSTAARDPSESLRAFLSRWEMNDFLFLLVVENLRPTEGLPAHQVAWFTVTPESWRNSVVSLVAARSGLAANTVPFILTRALLSVVFLVLACGLAKWVEPKTAGKTSNDSAARFLEAAFLTLAWFWLLLPTQNPWYLVWCLPLLPFARNRAWLALSGLAFCYYIRFWLTSQFPTPLLGTPYPGPQFFDYIVTWLEYVPWFVWLMCGDQRV